MMIILDAETIMYLYDLFLSSVYSILSFFIKSLLMSYFEKQYHPSGGSLSLYDDGSFLS